jgi:hypothetical protein
MRKLRRRTWPASIALGAMLGAQVFTPMGYAHGGNSAEPSTATPIKHVIVLIGENRTFDNVFGTYQPRHGQQIGNLLSRGIVSADGSPGPNSSAAEQFSVNTPFPTDSKYFTSADSANKSPYSPLPTPQLNGAPNQPLPLGSTARVRQFGIRRRAGDTGTVVGAIGSGPAKHWRDRRRRNDRS